MQAITDIKIIGKVMTFNENAELIKSEQITFNTEQELIKKFDNNYTENDVIEF